MNRIIRRYMLQHAHPMKFTAELLGVIWGAYFLWNHNWLGALIMSTLFFLGSSVLLWNKPIDYLQKTGLGRVMLIYADPVSFLLYNLSALPVIYGLWLHQTMYVLIGISILLLPHLWGWKELS